MPRTRAGQKGQRKGGGALVFDLSAHRLADRYDVPIVAPDGAATPMVVTLASRHGPEYRRRKAALDRAARDAMVGAPEVTAEAFAETEVLNIITAQVVAWAGFVVDGAAMDCTPETARALFTSPGLGWLYDQVADASFARERFFVSPSNAS